MSALPIKSPRWIEWRPVKRKSDGKPIKTPVKPGTETRLNAYAARDYWTRAQLSVQAKPGYVLGMNGDSAIIGIDLDTCRSKTGKLTPWAREALDAWGSYAEVSPSGTGVKAF